MHAQKIYAYTFKGPDFCWDIGHWMQKNMPCIVKEKFGYSVQKKKKKSILTPNGEKDRSMFIKW